MAEDESVTVVRAFAVGFHCPCRFQPLCLGTWSSRPWVNFFMASWAGGTRGEGGLCVEG